MLLLFSFARIPRTKLHYYYIYRVPNIFRHTLGFGYRLRWPDVAKHAATFMEISLSSRMPFLFSETDFPARVITKGWREEPRGTAECSSHGRTRTRDVHDLHAQRGTWAQRCEQVETCTTSKVEEPNATSQPLAARYKQQKKRKSEFTLSLPKGMEQPPLKSRCFRCERKKDGWKCCIVYKWRKDRSGRLHLNAHRSVVLQSSFLEDLKDSEFLEIIKIQDIYLNEFAELNNDFLTGQE